MAKTPKVDINQMNLGTDRETIVSIALGAIVVIVIGSLAFRYFRGTPDTTSNDLPQTGVEEVVTVDQLPGQVETATDEAGRQVPVNLPAKYTVQEGDSTWKIAEAFYGSGFNYVDIEQENNLLTEQGLVPGMELVIPQVPVRSASEAGLHQTEVRVTEQALPTDQAAGPSKGDDSAAQMLME